MPQFVGRMAIFLEYRIEAPTKKDAQDFFNALDESAGAEHELLRQQVLVSDSFRGRWKVKKVND